VSDAKIGSGQAGGVGGRVRHVTGEAKRGNANTGVYDAKLPVTSWMMPTTRQMLVVQDVAFILSVMQAGQSIGIVAAIAGRALGGIAALTGVIVPPMSSDAMNAMIVATADKRWRNPLLMW
jgi:uncharacterized membrane protein